MATQSIYLLSTAALSAELIEEAVAKGIVLDTMNFIATEPVDDEALSARIGELGRQRLTAVFTSTNAVEAVGDVGGSDWMIYCTNGATRQLVAERFGVDSIEGTAQSALALAEVVMADIGCLKEIFFFCGDRRRDELPDMLKGAGLTVHEVVVYRTLPTPQKAERAYAGIAFFSPSAVESFFSMNQVDAEVSLFAIGKTTGSALQARCKNPVIISERPGKEALVHTMIDQFQTNNKE